MKKFAAVAIVSAAALSLSGCALLYPNWGSTQKPGDPQPIDTSGAVSQSPTPTSSEAAPPQMKSAQINIIESIVDSTAGNIMVVAEVTNVSEDGGKCTITLTNGGVTKSVTVKAESNASSTQCFPAYVPITGIPKGKATINVAYSSTAYSGSKNTGVTIP